MKIFCSWSGIEFQVSTFTHKASVSGIHPIFYASARQLYNRQADWYYGRLNDDECRLLFCALLKATELVEFQTTCCPSVSIVQKNIEKLFRFINWKMDSIYSNAHFPHYIVRLSNANLNNIAEYLNELLAFLDPAYYRQQLRRSNSSAITKEAVLERFIKSNVLKSPAAFRASIARWFLQAADVPERLHEEWSRLLQYDYYDFQLYKEHPDSFESMLYWAEEKLDHGTISSNTLLKHLRELQLANANGMEYFLGLRTKETTLPNGDDWMIIEDAEKAAIAAVVATAPVAMPLRDNFPSDNPGHFQFLLATAKWKLAQQSAALAAQEQAIAMQQQQQASEDNDITHQTDDELLAEMLEDEAAALQELHSNSNAQHSSNKD